jgi:hypothetical protein
MNNVSKEELENERIKNKGWLSVLWQDQYKLFIVLPIPALH